MDYVFIQGLLVTEFTIGTLDEAMNASDIFICRCVLLLVIKIDQDLYSLYSNETNIFFT
jgi:hypothetical protein